jgi:hypothetical protein
MADDNHTPATAVASYALWWGLMTTLARKGLLSKEDLMDALDSGLHWLEENQKNFPDQQPALTARAMLESLMDLARD